MDLGGFQQRPVKKRKVLSCFDCRRRKQKCDRGYPVCARCQKTGLAATCTYDAAPGEGTDIPGPDSSNRDFDDNLPEQDDPARGMSVVGQHVPHSVLARFHEQETRLLTLENRVRAIEASTAVDVPISAPNHKASANLHELLRHRSHYNTSAGRHSGIRTEQMFFKGKRFKTEFYGATEPWSSCSQLMSEARPLVRDAHCHSQKLKHLINVTDSLEDKASTEQASRLETLDKTDLTRLLPPKIELDRLFELYFAIYGKTYKVLHEPSFWGTYEKFWRDQSAVDVKFVMVMLLSAAAVKSARPEDFPLMIGDDSAASFEAVEWIEACEARMNKDERKTRFRRPIGLVGFQLRCLLLLAKKANFFKTKLTWNQAGALIQSGLESGLHREPTLLRRGSTVFHNEMRRRIWAVIVNLELEVSIERGMPALSTAFFKDCQAPLNIEDDDFGEDSRELPSPKLAKEFTSVSFLIHSLNSIPLRTTLSAILNSPDIDLSYEETMNYHNELLSQLDAIPRWRDGSEEDLLRTQSALPQISLDLQLRQMLLMIHLPYVQQHEFSRTCCIENACQIIDYHTKLSATGNHGLPLMRRDVFRAAVNICRCLSIHKDPSSILIRTDLARSARQFVDHALLYFENKIIRHGHGLRSYWLLCAVYETLRRRQVLGFPTDAYPTLIERFLDLYQRIISYQRDSDAATKLLNESPSGGDRGSTKPRPEDEFLMPDFNQPTAQGLEYLDVPGWMFDDFQLFNFEMPYEQ